MINSFTGPYFFLSNFYIHTIDGYRSSEHYYQAMKTFDENIRREFLADPGIDADGKPIPLLTSGQAKRRGAEISLRPDWESVKLHTMKLILQKKFSDPILKQKLLDTGNQELREGNNWHDNYWGWCNCISCADRLHNNHLGILLMEIREDCKVNEFLNPYFDAIKITKVFLKELLPEASDEVIEHNAGALFARLCAHNPSIFPEYLKEKDE